MDEYNYTGGLSVLGLDSHGNHKYQVVPGYVNGSGMDWNSTDYDPVPALYNCSIETNSTNSSFTGCNVTNMATSEPVSEPCIPPYTLWQLIILALLAGSTILLTVIGNLVVILSFIIERAIRQPTNYFIASLACSDLLIGLISMPFYTVYLLMGQYWPMGEVLCDLWLSIDYTVCLISIYTVFCITIDRFCMVKIPAKYRSWRTERKVLLIIAATWIIPAFVFFTSIFGWQYFVGERTVQPTQCYVQYMEDALFNMILQIGYFWVTLTVMCALYTGIYKVALDLHKKSAAKHKKMTSLVSMAGQTMTKIGIGMSQQRPNVDATGTTRLQSQDSLKPVANRAVNGNTANTNNNQLSKKTGSNTTSFSTPNKHHDHDDRSSSPVFPSDTEPSSQSPSRHHSPKPTRKGGGKAIKSKAKMKSKPNGKIQKGKKSKAALNGSAENAVPKPLPPPPRPAAVSAQADVQRPSSLEMEEPPVQERLCSPVSSFAEDNKTPVYENSALNIDKADESPAKASPFRSCQGDLAMIVSSPPELLSGLRYIDQDSLKSLGSNDTIRLLVGGNGVSQSVSQPDAALLEEEPDSPIWKPRDALLSDADALVGHGSPLKLSPPPLRAPKKTGSQKQQASSNHRGSADVGERLAAVPDYGGVYVAAPAEPVPFFPPTSSKSKPSAESRPSMTGTAKSTAKNVEANDLQIESHVSDSRTVTRVVSNEDLRSFKTHSIRSSGRRSDKSKSKSSPLRALLKTSSRKTREKEKKEAAAAAGAAKQKSKSENRARKALRTITIILGAFVLCWTPWHILSLIIGFMSSPNCGIYILYDISYWLCYLNSPINPFCYAFANQQFKKTFIRIIKLDWHRT